MKMTLNKILLPLVLIVTIFGACKKKIKNNNKLSYKLDGVAVEANPENINNSVFGNANTFGFSAAGHSLSLFIDKAANGSVPLGMGGNKNVLILIEGGESYVPGSATANVTLNDVTNKKLKCTFSASILVPLGSSTDTHTITDGVLEMEY
jgi:hypothetical protein